MSSTEPLVIIDGVPAGLGDFYALSSTDVESVSVLKDASSAAIYYKTGAIILQAEFLNLTRTGCFEYSSNVIL